VGFGQTIPLLSRRYDMGMKLRPQPTGRIRSTLCPTFQKLKRSMPNAFASAGGDFRMVVAFDWRRSIAFIKFLGTHAEYDRIDAINVSLF